MLGILRNCNIFFGGTGAGKVGFGVVYIISKHHFLDRGLIHSEHLWQGINRKKLFVKWCKCAKGKREYKFIWLGNRPIFFTTYSERFIRALTIKVLYNYSKRTRENGVLKKCHCRLGKAYIRNTSLSLILFLKD